jgi:hypothetical protein
MNRLAAKRFRTFSATRLLLAAFLLFGIFAGAVPLQAVLASPACRLACCAKRTPHSAGSCADGSCHASLKHKGRAARQHSASNFTRELCGLTRKSPVESKTRPVNNLASATTAAAEAASALGTPCPPECSGTVANSTSQRNSAATSVSIHARPVPLQRISLHSTHAKPTEVSCGECAPRGPPLAFS